MKYNPLSLKGLQNFGLFSALAANDKGFGGEGLDMSYFKMHTFEGT
jgi:hypothetical protein